jgi:hypothetical protein
MPTFFHRMIGVAVFDAATYDDIERDQKATAQAMGVVVLAGIAAGLGTPSSQRLGAVVTLSLIALLSWACWAMVTFEVARRLLPDPREVTDFGRLLRTFGFAASPGLLRLAGLVPAFALPAMIASAVWMTATMVMALRQGLEYHSTGRAIAICAVGWLLSVGVAFALQLAFITRVS